MSYSTSNVPVAGDVRSLAKQFKAQRDAPRIVRLELILTEACNLGCTYCFEYQADASKSMTSETALAAVDFFIRASRDAPSIGITFMGGEPVLAYELIRQVVSYARKAAAANGKSVTFDMQTNGVLLNEEHARYFQKVGLRYCLSLDGVSVTHDRNRRTLGGKGTFQIVAAKLKMLRRYQRWQGARMTIVPTEAAHLAENIQALHEELSINQFIIGFATHVQWSDEQIADYANGLMRSFDYFAVQRVHHRSRQLRIGLFELGQFGEAYVAGNEHAWGCGAGSGRLAVGADGVFHGCSKLAWATSGSRDAPVPLGSVETGLSRPENRLKLLDHSDGPRTKCQKCEIRGHCQGGCHAANFADTGDIFVPADYFCKLMFAQKQACEYARIQIRELGISNLYWSSDVRRSIEQWQ